MDLIGIYCIYFPKQDLIYIGQSTRINARLTCHRNSLERGDHSNYKLQQAYLYELPMYEILELCKIDELNSLEEFYIKEFDSVNKGLNILIGGQSEKRGYHSPKCHYTEYQILEAIEHLASGNDTLDTISSITGISKDTLNSIISGKRHAWVQERFPEKFKQIRSNISKRLSLAQENRFKTLGVLISPEGVEHTVTNAAKFAKEHNLNPSHTSAILKGRSMQHKGWTLKKGGVNNE